MPEVHRAGDRFLTRGDGVSTRHSFSYGDHYDPANVGFGPLIALNTETVDAGAGYDVHRHADVEIVTWVLRGSLLHEDSTGRHGIIEPGTAQRLSAGTGVEHSERNASTDEPLVFVQMMLASNHNTAPEYAQADVTRGPGLTETIDVHAPATLLVVHLEAGAFVTIPDASRSLVHVTAGTVSLKVGEPQDTDLHEGDEARLTAAGEYAQSASAPADALIWQLER